MHTTKENQLFERFRALADLDATNENLEELTRLLGEAEQASNAELVRLIRNEITAVTLDLHPELGELYEQARQGSYSALTVFHNEVGKAGLESTAYPEDHDTILVRTCPGIPHPYEFKSDVVNDLYGWQNTHGLLFMQAIRAIRVDNPDPVKAAYILALCITEPQGMTRMLGPAGSELTYDLGMVVDQLKANAEMDDEHGPYLHG